MSTDIEDFYIDNTSDYMDIDEEEIDWNERILEMEEEPEETDIDPDAESDDEDSENDIEPVDDEEDDDEPTVTTSGAVDKKKFRTIKLTDKYISQQLTLPEFMRDRFRFRYHGEPMYGHIIMISKAGKYIFDIVDIKTGQHSTKFLDGEFIDNY